MVLVIVAMDGYAAVVGDRPWHGCHSCDDAGRRVVAQDGVCSFPSFPSATKDEDLAIAHRHATALLQEGRDRNLHLQHQCTVYKPKILAATASKLHIGCVFYKTALYT